MSMDAREFVLRAEGQTNGMAWVDLLFQKHARVLFELQWMVFQIGQAGSFIETVKRDKERKGDMLEMLDQIEGSCADLAVAVEEVAAVARDIISNSKMNVEKICR